MKGTEEKLAIRQAVVLDLATEDYARTLKLQRELQKLRIDGAIPDCLLVLEHPPTFTLGRAGGADNILVSGDRLYREGIGVYNVERGGDVTYHGPGQLVGYPILDLKNYEQDVHRLVERLEEVLIRTLVAYGITAGRRSGLPGVWVEEAKIASIGLAVTRWVTMHGFALNVHPDLRHFGLINPCGLQGVSMASMSGLLGHQVSLEEVKSRVVEEMAGMFGWEVLQGDHRVEALLRRLGLAARNFRPGWLTVTPPGPGVLESMAGLLERCGLHTVCEGACCPNAAECFALGTATFMILGDTCTRNCRFCSVSKGIPGTPDPGEPLAVAEAVRELGLRHAVITSVTRDDLPDGGAGHFAAMIRAVHRLNPHTTVEVLVPDFQGSEEALAEVLAARPEVLGHNLETVPRLYKRVRPGANYRRSLELLARARELAPGVVTKSGLMVGLGEGFGEVLTVLDDLRAAGCAYITIGQYLQPSTDQLPVHGFIPPELFARYRKECLRRGFKRADCGPLVRSSYHAASPDAPGVGFHAANAASPVEHEKEVSRESM
ncbi:lipoic acid synthetase [Desulfotomaculum arcticum]|uniref:Multifunctional fusion protein n=1 Tax=Desulfotruncus arcticus DSM 17038 TaxID=1121424 RepID=A0A1I2UVA1_9FIRM|nr:lipoyl synthase [Desulfotruncus arcticus]SFG78691.1 lipoic acid synthetase [Desulfotomaculum arcticum] [Desulfotruncus arcticus DSM 17038]